MQVVHDVGVFVVALAVVGEDIALIVADVKGVSGGRRAVETVVSHAVDSSFHGCFEVINVGIGVFSLQVGLSQASVESSFGPNEGHVADFMKGTQCGINEEVLMVCPQSNVFNFDSVDMEMFEVRFVQHLMEVLF